MAGFTLSNNSTDIFTFSVFKLYNYVKATQSWHCPIAGIGRIDVLTVLRIFQYYWEYFINRNVFGGNIVGFKGLECKYYVFFKLLTLSGLKFYIIQLFVWE